MPPKKDGKKKKKKKVAKTGDATTVEEKYDQTLKKIDSLQSELVLRTEIARRSKATSSDLRLRIKEVNELSEEEKQNKYDISTDLIRQYKSMQLDLTSKIKSLENNNASLSERLNIVNNELKNERKNKERIVKEKDDIIYDLEYKVEHMEAAYENILHDAFDLMDIKLDEAKVEWKHEALSVQRKNKDLLLQFGLNPLDI